jgi:hypothetical protein
MLSASKMVASEPAYPKSQKTTLDIHVPWRHVPGPILWQGASAAKISSSDAPSVLDTATFAALHTILAGGH